jgi:5-(carboxyamino)imidazole ribonucleotide mutase
MMPTGVPVATVAIDGAGNAAFLAAQILGLSDGELQRRLLEQRESLAERVGSADRRVQTDSGEAE